MATHKGICPIVSVKCTEHGQCPHVIFNPGEGGRGMEETGGREEGRSQGQRRGWGGREGGGGGGRERVGWGRNGEGENKACNQ